MPQTHIFKDNQTVAQAFAKYLANEISKVDTFHIALSGGSTPKVLFELLAKNYAKKIDWKKVHFYWGDERCVSPQDSDSNYGMTYEKLIKHINIPKKNIHRVKGEDEASKEAIRYGKELEKNLYLVDGWPVFNLIILGMGSDGHTASIFPKEIHLLKSKNFCEVATHPDSGQKRITFTGGLINAAQAIHFLVTGASKQDKIKEIFSKKGKYKNYPASHINATAWWMDSAAANKAC